MKIKPCTVLDVAELAEAVEKTTLIDAIPYVSQDIKLNKWFYRRGVALQFQILGDHKCAIHLFGTPQDSLRELRDWVIGCGSWMFDNTEISCLLVFCRENDLHLRFLIRATGAERCCRLIDADGYDGDELLFVYSKSYRELYEGKVKCHKQYQQ